MKAPKLLNSPYFISGSLHLLLLMILALIIMKPLQKEVWHSFEWGETPDLLPPEPIDPIEAPEASIPQQSEESPTPAATQAPIPQTQTPPVMATPQSPTVAPSLPTREEHIEAPRFSDREVSTPPPAPPRVGRRLVPSLTQGTPSGSGDGFEMLVGDGVEAIRSPRPVVQYTDHVILDIEFKLSSDGKIRMDTIIPITLAPQTHLDATRAALANWEFRFLGPYRRDQIYRIRFRFTPRSS